jgi:hypothetical protein
MSESVVSVQPQPVDNKDMVPKDNMRVVTVENGNGRYMYSVFHTIMSLVAIYLAFRCNKGFEVGPFLVAAVCPYLYIVYILATRGTCGILENEGKL